MKSKNISIPESPHSLSIAEVVRSLEVNTEKGLFENEVELRRRDFGSNDIPPPKLSSIFERIFRELINPLVFILVVALGLTVYLNEYLDALVICLAIIVNISISLYQEGRARNIFTSLKKEQARSARVLRGGHNEIINSFELVPGDTVFISAGESVPADVRILEAEDPKANEASLTGEWESVSKDSGTVDKKLSLSERSNMLWAGTLMAAGQAKGVVVATGPNTEFGKLSATINHKSEITPLQEQLKKVATLISVAVLTITIIVLLIGIWRGQPMDEMILIAVALAVGAVPEGLPAAVTVILATGMRSLLKSGGLVKSLLAAETLGTTDTIITDKTGTLTEGKMSLVGIISADTEIPPSNNELSDLTTNQKNLLLFSLLTSDGYLTKKDGDWVANGRPVEKALVEAGLHFDLNRTFLNDADHELDFLPFSSERRFAAVITEGDHGKYAVLSGAPEYLLSQSNLFTRNEELVQLTESDKARLSTIQKTLTSRGQRLIAVSRAVVDQNMFSDIGSENEVSKKLSPKLEFLGFLAFTDPVRRNVPAAINDAQMAKARVIVATGDNPNTALAISKQAGVTNNGIVMEGVDLTDLTEDELYQKSQEVSVFARMKPSQKQRLASVMQNRGHIVAMTGDGINDAPALSHADIGIAVQSGTDVAKAAADLVLLENSFATIVAAIKEGRKLLDNVRKAVVHLVSTGFGEIFLVTGALILATPLPVLPSQILWVNIIQGGLLTFAFAFEPAEEDVMRRSPKSPGARGILTPQAQRLLWGAGIITGILTLIVFIVAYMVQGMPIEEVRSLMFAILTFDAIVFALALKDFEKPITEIKIGSNKILLGSIGINLGLLIMSFALPPARHLLSLVVPSVSSILVMLTVIFIDLVLIETLKRLIFRKKD